MKPLAAVVREMNDLAERLYAADMVEFAAQLRDGSAAITEHLARLESLASELDADAELHWKTLRDGVRQGGIGDGLRYASTKLRALLGPAGEPAAGASGPARIGG